MIKGSYHNHTDRCKHAIGSEQEMIEAAINLGVEEFGLSDHIPIPWGNPYVYRMDYDQKQAYLDECQRLKIKYQSKINFKVGFEAEYQLNRIEDYKNMLKTGQIDYLVLGQHYSYDEHDSRYFGFISDTNHIKNYVDLVIKGMETGLFAFVAHPDLFMQLVEQWDDNCQIQSTRLIQKAIELDIPLEVNAGGIRREGLISFKDGMRYRYPTNKFFELVKELGAKVIVGTDAHAPEDINDDAYQAALSFAKEKQLNIIEQIDWRKYHDGFKF